MEQYQPIEGISPYEINILKQITEAFKVFDVHEEGKITIKNVETIARALGRVPRNTEMKELIKQIEDKKEKGYAKLEDILPALKQILLEDKWSPSTKEEILEAFEYFDSEKKGSLNPNYIRNILTEHGDELNSSEIEKFLNVIVDPSTEQIEYRSSYEKLVIPDVVDILDDRRQILKELRYEMKN